MDRVKQIWYLSPMRAAKVQASLRIRAVSPEPPLLTHTSIESRRTFRQKTRSLAPLNGWACAVKICHDGMLEDTNSLDVAHMYVMIWCSGNCFVKKGQEELSLSAFWHFSLCLWLLKTYDFSFHDFLYIRESPPFRWPYIYLPLHTYS